MLRLSKKMIFAIEAVVDIAYHSSGQPVQSQEITRRQNIPGAIWSRRCKSSSARMFSRVCVAPGADITLPAKGGASVLGTSSGWSGILKPARTWMWQSGLELTAKVITPMWQDLQCMMKNWTAFQLTTCVPRRIAQVESEGRQNLIFLFNGNSAKAPKRDSGSRAW